MKHVKQDLAKSTGRAHLIMHPQDNVTTLLDDLCDLTALIGGGSVSPGISFGHKAALEAISQGSSIIKYNVTIGHATQNIKAGEHVHVHNCR